MQNPFEIIPISRGYVEKDAKVFAVPFACDGILELELPNSLNITELVGQSHLAHDD